MSGKSNFEIAAEQGYCGELPEGHFTRPVRYGGEPPKDESGDAPKDENEDADEG